MPFWLKFKWRMAHSRNRGTWNREPPPPTLDSRFGGVIHLPHSPLLQLHPLAASSTSSDFASIPHIPFSHPSTLPPLQPPCLLHFASTPYLPLSHPSTLPTLQPPCLLHFASTPYIPLSHPSIHPYLHLCNLPASSTSPHHPTFHSPIHPHLHLCNLPASSTSPQHPTLHSPSIRTSPSCATTAA